MTRGTALVANVGRVVQLTGRTSLPNLETDGELSLPDLLVTASDAIYDRLETDGHDPTALSNAQVYERAVAFKFLAILATQGYGLRGDETREQAVTLLEGAADRAYLEVKPRASTSTAEKTASGVPAVWNLGQDGPELDYWRNAP
jgi:hypothetical protein